jgi:hypothetical protein
VPVLTITLFAVTGSFVEGWGGWSGMLGRQAVAQIGSLTHVYLALGTTVPTRTPTSHSPSPVHLPRPTRDYTVVPSHLSPIPSNFLKVVIS